MLLVIVVVGFCWHVASSTTTPTEILLFLGFVVTRIEVYRLRERNKPAKASKTRRVRF